MRKCRKGYIELRVCAIWSLASGKSKGSSNVRNIIKFLLQFYAASTSPCFCGISGLNNEIFNNSVKREPIVETIFNEVSNDIEMKNKLKENEEKRISELKKRQRKKDVKKKMEIDLEIELRINADKVVFVDPEYFVVDERKGVKRFISKY